jgi:hypothetical protein
MVRQVYVRYNFTVHPAYFSAGLLLPSGNLWRHQHHRRSFSRWSNKKKLWRHQHPRRSFSRWSNKKKQNNKPVWPAWAVGALFRGARRIASKTRRSVLPKSGQESSTEAHTEIQLLFSCAQVTLEGVYRGSGGGLEGVRRSVNKQILTFLVSFLLT